MDTKRTFKNKKRKLAVTMCITFIASKSWQRRMHETDDIKHTTTIVELSGCKICKSPQTNSKPARLLNTRQAFLLIKQILIIKIGIIKKKTNFATRTAHNELRYTQFPKQNNTINFV